MVYRFLFLITYMYLENLLWIRVNKKIDIRLTNLETTMAENSTIGYNFIKIQFLKTDQTPFPFYNLTNYNNVT